MSSTADIQDAAALAARKAELKAKADALFAKVTFNQMIGLKREFAEAGVSRLVLPINPQLFNNFGVVHGGVLMSMLDSTMTAAALSRFEFERLVVTVDLQTQFVKSGRGVLTGHGKVVGGGKSLAFCEGRIEDEQGDLVAKASAVFKYVTSA
ncbi:thioesterase [Comamonas serinivorans]|uniref:Medium/long-chain acyl-CoA thioesterase YigI n=1 Tax=Comamonas serinivorans TaxID=1082851 RepID=A0A1Y0EIQ9_9BURK|nr:PaaI family thioesterase [Comamonas serinivorans]ARU03513.1 thioesterase [Comamonas serinivorans]